MTDPYFDPYGDGELEPGVMLPLPSQVPGAQEPWNRYGPYELGWRTVVRPAGTAVEDVVTEETARHAADGRTLDPATVRVETSYLLPTPGLVGVPQDVVAAFGSVVVTYRLATQ